MRVLLVEDSVDAAQAIQIHLERLGHTVDWETNGTGAAITCKVLWISCNKGVP